MIAISKRLETTLLELHCTSEKEIQTLLDQVWKEQIAKEAKKRKRPTFSSIFHHRIKKGYQQPFKSRSNTSIWHRARLRVLPVKKFLFKIGKRKSPLFDKCKKEETVQHILTGCKTDHKENPTDLTPWLSDDLPEKQVSDNA